MKLLPPAVAAALVTAAVAWQSAAPDWQKEAEDVLAWRVGVSLAGIPASTFYEAADRAAALGVKYVQGFDRQQVSADIPKRLDFNLSQKDYMAEREKLRAADLRMLVYQVTDVPADETVCRKIFDFAQRNFVETLVVADPKADVLPLLDRLANEYGLNVAIRGRTPRSALDACRPFSRRMGVCADLDAWARQGTRPAEAVQAIGDRLLTVELSSGSAGIAELLKAVYRHTLVPTMFSIGSENRGSDPARTLEVLQKTIVPLTLEHRSWAARTKAPRRFAGISAYERKLIEAALPAAAPAKPRKPRKLLVFSVHMYPTRQIRFGHPSIAHSKLAVELMGRKTGAYEAVFNNDLAMLKLENLRRFDAIYLNNAQGPLFNTPELRAGLLTYIREGGGLIGTHSASYTDPEWPEFAALLGARQGWAGFDDQKVVIRPEEPRHPLAAMFHGEAFEWHDEIFRFREPYSRENLRVLLTIDTTRTEMTGPIRRDDGDYAISWIRKYGDGRVFYSALGHSPRTFWQPRILKHFLAGFQFALGDLGADAQPSGPPHGKWR